jgi:hypothetical protein
MTRCGVLLVLAALAIAGCTPRGGGEPESIGIATMEADGTIVLQLRAALPGGGIGEGYFRYPPSHEEYAKVLEHLGGLEPGQSKPVEPFPE